jgi:hypothetical protein
MVNTLRIYTTTVIIVRDVPVMITAGYGAARCVSEAKGRGEVPRPWEFLCGFVMG